MIFSFFKNKNRTTSGLVVAVGLLLTACNLTRDVEIELPAYESQPVVECYLEPGKPFRLLLTRSYSFFDPLGLDSNFLEKTLLQDATVSITVDGQRIELANQFSFEPAPLKLFNYTAAAIVPATPGLTYTLDIVLADGKRISGQTTMLPRVTWDSIPVQFNPSDTAEARTLAYITDDMSRPNFYRRMLHYGGSLDSVAQQDFLVDDRFSTSSTITFGMGYDLAVGDTVINSILHIEQAYFNFLESYQLAVAGASNPFAQPSPIISNVSGDANPLGIFTCLVVDRDTTVVAR
jgi:hypothetical protein